MSYHVPSVSSSDGIKHGEMAGSATAVQCPTVPCLMVVIKAASTNAGSVFIGSSSSVTKMAGTTTTTAGYELTAGQTETFYVKNLNFLYRICDNAGDDATYLAYVA